MKRGHWLAPVALVSVLAFCAPAVRAGLPSDSSSLILERARIRANTATRPGRQNGKLKIDGTLNANAPFGGFVDDIEQGGLSIRIIGAGNVDVTLPWLSSDCTVRSSPRGPRVSCRAEAAREVWEVQFRPRPIPNLFDVKVRAKRFDVPPLALDRVTVIVSTSSLAREDDIGGCKLFGRRRDRLTCRETGVVPTPTLTPTPTVTPTNTFDPSISLCGDGIVGGEETCDDGGACIGGSNDTLPCVSTDDCPGGTCRPVGGDGCAVNCTVERSRRTALAPGSIAVVQQATFAIFIPLQATLNLRSGEPRTQDAFDIRTVLVAPAGSYPLTLQPVDVAFNPVRVTGLVCACPRLIEVPLFGPGNAGVGSIACGPQGLTGIDYRLVQDHNTNPGHLSNGNTPPMVGLQLPDDPECDDTFAFPAGTVSEACLEGQDALCSDPNASGQHPGVCNSPRELAYSGGQGPPGSALIHTGIAIGLLNDGGLCRLDLQPGNPLCPRDYGPDCLPCTGDDADLGRVETIALTTGTASAAVYDAAFQKGRTMDVVDPPVPCASLADCQAGQVCIRQCEQSGSPCPTGNECGGDTCLPLRCSWNGCGTSSFISRCITTALGTAFDCAELAADQTPNDGDGDGLSGATLAVAYPSLDALRIGDNVTTMSLQLE